MLKIGHVSDSCLFTRKRGLAWHTFRSIENTLFATWLSRNMWANALTFRASSIRRNLFQVMRTSSKTWRTCMSPPRLPNFAQLAATMCRLLFWSSISSTGRKLAIGKTVARPGRTRNPGQRHAASHRLVRQYADIPIRAGIAQKGS